MAAERLDSGLCDQIRDFVEDHPDTTLVAVDIFQQIRTSREDSSYANDYEDIGQLKALADELGITVLLVHHNRKMRDSDPLNNPSGTTGISGALDTILVLDRSKREEDCATLYCTGRDVPTRQLELRMKSDTCAWELLSDSLEHPEKRLPIEMEKLVDFMKERGSYRGGNSEFTASFNAFAGTNFTAKALKQQMNRYRFLLEDMGVRFENRRSNGQRLLDISFSSPASDASDAENLGPVATLPASTCVPVRSP